MRIPKIHGVIRRRILVNFRADPAVVARLLPQPFRPKLHGNHSLVGICLIRLEQIRPLGFPGFLGVASENAAHRIAVEWNDAGGGWREGVYIPRRDSSSLLNQLLGGRVFPGVHHAARFAVVDKRSGITLAMRSYDGSTAVDIAARDATALPASSCFASLAEASAYFETGSLGFSASSDPHRSDGLLLRTREWRIAPLEVSAVSSSYFSDPRRFPAGSVCFDHALIMRDIDHEWHGAEAMPHPAEGKSG